MADQDQAVTPEVAEHICKRCGFDQSQTYDPVSEEDLQEYFKVSLGQVSFTKTYELFDGRIRCTFEEPTGKLLRLQEMVMLSRAEAHKGSLSDAADFALLSSLAEIVQVPENGAIPRIMYTAERDKRVQILTEGVIPPEIEDMPIIRLQAIRAAYGQFSKLCTQLAWAAQDENFWKGVGRS